VERGGVSVYVNGARLGPGPMATDLPQRVSTERIGSTLVHAIHLNWLIILIFKVSTERNVHPQRARNGSLPFFSRYHAASHSRLSVKPLLQFLATILSMKCTCLSPRHTLRLSVPLSFHAHPPPVCQITPVLLPQPASPAGPLCS
jgi:hypothetical protein